MFEIAKPAFDCWGEVGNNYAHAVASGTSRLLAYFVLEPLQALLPHPAPACLKPVAQKFETLPLYQTVPYMGLVRV